MESLAVIIPVYNEEDIIETVINEWLVELDKLSLNYTIFAYNDGSKDNTAKILEKIANKNPKLFVINQENLWHGPTILKGYKNNAPKFDWIFQIDADREMGPEGFNQLWEARLNNDFIIVIRKGRLQSLIRSIISFISRMCIKIFYGKGPWDVNSPYRLMKSEKFKDIFNQLPDKTLSPNMVISGIVAKKKIKFCEIPVPCAVRQTGQSLNKFKLLKTSIKSCWQTIIFSFIVK